MSRRELNADRYTEAPVDCAGPNTSEVVAVTTLPAGVGYARLGGMNAYSLGCFLPTKAQRAAGARWVRCDLIRQGGRRLLPLPDSLDVGSFPFPREASLCLTGKRRLHTSCSERHTYRATSVWKVRAKRYPSRDAWLRLGFRKCPRGATTPRRFWVTWSGRASWATGDRAFVCHSRTRR